ncbi:MAG: flagellar assembly protein FliH [Rhodocyclaceae bacterium]|nr:flagellar assembly protein FliH [Rhodocyclaceae bacterium]
MSIPKEKMTAWQRWELADFSEKPAPPVVAPPAPVAEAPPPAPEPEPPQPEYKLPTLEEIEQIHQQAHKDGYAAGYEEGTARVRMEAMRLSSLSENLDQAFANLDKDIAEELLALALEIARQVIRQDIAAKPEVLLTVIKEALLQLPHQHAAIYLHPEDANLVKNYIGEQLSHAGHRILEEPGLERGGCRVEAAGSQIDGTLETRWRRVLESIGLKGEWIEQTEDGA